MQTKRSPISGPRLGFGWEEHLKRRGEISRVFKKGRSVSCYGAKLFFLENGLSWNRIVITFARKYGNAVERNRARRLGREAYRLMKSGLKTGYDMVLLVYPRTGNTAQSAADAKAEASRITLAETAKRLTTLFSRAGIR